MIAFNIRPVIPTRPLWVVMMFLIGIFGMIAQVCVLFRIQYSISILKSPRKDAVGYGLSEGDGITWKPRYVYLGVSPSYCSIFT
jgi:hypothetical protein